jgi:hypothetical protein
LEWVDGDQGTGWLLKPSQIFCFFVAGNQTFIQSLAIMLGRILTSNSRRILQHNNAVATPVRRDVSLCVRRQYASAAQLPNSQPEKVISAAQHFKRQKHLPFFLEYFMWVVFGSEALHLIWLKIDQQEYRDKTNHQIAVLKEVLLRLEKGEAVDDNLHTEISMLLKKQAGQKKGDVSEIDDEYLEKRE